MEYGASVSPVSNITGRAQHRSFSIPFISARLTETPNFVFWRSSAPLLRPVPYNHQAPPNRKILFFNPLRPFEALEYAIKIPQKPHRHDHRVQRPPQSTRALSIAAHVKSGAGSWRTSIRPPVRLDAARSPRREAKGPRCYHSPRFPPDSYPSAAVPCDCPNSNSPASRLLSIRPRS